MTLHRNTSICHNSADSTRGTNPYTYTQFIVTEEPFQDADPNAASATGGTQLQTPFGD